MVSLRENTLYKAKRAAPEACILLDPGMNLHARLLCTAAALALSASALAQAPRGDDVRGSAPPGTLGSDNPSDGAIRGGSILPGEMGGRPDAGRGATTPRERVERCAELTGTLREQCLADEQKASSGSPRPSPGSTGPADAPPSDPPPQTPR
jgi:hypothetical protein